MPRFFSFIKPLKSFYLSSRNTHTQSNNNNNLWIKWQMIIIEKKDKWVIENPRLSCQLLHFRDGTRWNLTKIFQFLFYFRRVLFVHSCVLCGFRRSPSRRSGSLKGLLWAKRFVKSGDDVSSVSWPVCDCVISYPFFLLIVLL